MRKLLYLSAATVMTFIVIMIMTAALGLSEAHALTPLYGLAENPVLNFNTSSNYEYEEIDFDVSNDNVDMVSLDESVCLVYNGKDFAGMGDEAGTTYWYIVPVGSGTATITATSKKDGSTWTGTVNVTKDYFQHMLDSGIGLGPVMAYRGSDVDAPEYFYTSKIAYGSSRLTVRAPYGAAVTLYVNGKKINSTKIAGWSERVDLKKSFLISMKTPVKVKIAWAEGAKKEYKVKIVSKSKITMPRIRKNSRKGKTYVYKIHKGDYLKIKVGKKVVKTVKFKKTISKKLVRWTTKKKMKKGKKVTAVLYNKYKQKLATKARRVG